MGTGLLKRKKIDPTSCTLLELAYDRTGSMLKAARVVAFVIGWGVVRQELGREPSVDEYADWWKEPRSTAFRHRDEFRVVFPDFDTPAPVLDHLEATRARHTDAIGWTALPA